MRTYRNIAFSLFLPAPVIESFVEQLKHLGFKANYMDFFIEVECDDNEELEILSIIGSFSTLHYYKH